MRNRRKKKINKEIQIFRNINNYLEKMMIKVIKRKEEIKARNYQTSKNISFKQIKRNKKEKRRRKIKKGVLAIIRNRSLKYLIHK